MFAGDKSAAPPKLDLAGLAPPGFGDDLLSPTAVKRRMEQEISPPWRSMRRRTDSAGDGGDSATAGLLSPTSAAAVVADTGYDSDGLLDSDFNAELPPPVGEHAAEPPFMGKLLHALTAAGAPPPHVAAVQHALDGTRLYTVTVADIESFQADNRRALRSHPGRVMPEVHALAGPTPLVAGSVIDPRGADLAHFPVEQGAGSHLYGGGSGEAHLHHADGGDAAAPSGGQRWRVKDEWATRFVTAAGAAITLLCCTGWYMLAAMNRLNYGAVFATSSGVVVVAAGALIITDLFSLVAGAREGGIKLSSPADLAVVAGRLAELLRVGVRLLRVSTGVGAEATLRALEASQAGAPRGTAAHYDVLVPFHGGAVRVHVLLGAQLPTGERGALIMLGSVHRCMTRMWWCAMALARSDLAFQCLLGRQPTPEQVAAVFAATRSGGLTPEEQLTLFAQLRAELTDAERVAVDEHMKKTGCDLLTALHEKVYAGKGARRFAELVVLEGEGALSEAEAKELSWRRLSRTEGKAAVTLAKAAVKMEQKRDKLPRATAAQVRAVDELQVLIGEAWGKQKTTADAFKAKRSVDSAARSALHRVGGRVGARDGCGGRSVWAYVRRASHPPPPSLPLRSPSSRPRLQARRHASLPASTS